MVPKKELHRMVWVVPGSSASVCRNSGIYDVPNTHSDGL